jgi:hypothetical protein
MRGASTNFRYRDRDFNIQAKWDAETKVWIATSNDLPGLVIEAETWQAMLNEVGLVGPDLIELSAAP